MMKEYDFFKLKQGMVKKYFKEHPEEEKLYWFLVKQIYGVEYQKYVYTQPFLALRKKKGE